MKRALWLTGTVALLALAGCDKLPGGKRADADVPEAPYPQQVYWGDTHLHTSNSIDAFGFGVRLGPEESLRFARGEEVTATMGMKAKLDRPLDFLVISDHSDGLGATKALYDAPAFLIRDPTLRRWHDMMHDSNEGSQRAVAEIINAVATGNVPDALKPTAASAKRQGKIWTNYTSIMDRYNEPGKFTALLGFEFTLMPKGDNLHRVVIFRDGKDRVDMVSPFPSLDPATTAASLWDYMDGYEKTTGGRVLAIPHNSNVSNGLMFEMTMPGGGPMTADYARRRVAHEPLVEATQIKGDSESHPFLSPNDEFASFGDAGWELGNLPLTAPKTNSMFAGEYVREALKRGLAIEAATGVNPFKLGMIGSTDSHTALSTADERNFFGKHSGNEPNARRAMQPQNLGTRQGRFGWQYLAGGYAAVWAKANTRAAIFDAMMRREVYASTGPRIKVRFFGGFNYGANALTGDWVKTAYAGGVPMGGDLTGGKGAPRFIVSATKDPDGANLDRVQVVKGWTDASGKLHEKVYNVVWSSPQTRTAGSDGRIPAVGDTANLTNASYTNSIGAPELSTIWTDPDFNASQKAFYYLRVLEIPTPRWVVYDAVRFHTKLADGIQPKTQERAYTSPIWYHPK